MENESWSHTDFQGHKTLANQLIQGMDETKQLRSLLNATSSSTTETGGDLALQRILSSYDKALLILHSSGSIGEQPQSRHRRWSDGLVKESQAPLFDASKKRETMSIRTAKVRVNPENGLQGPPPPPPHDDDVDDEDGGGFSWKKWGQKYILGAKYPRSYYRCIHRNLKGCLATKQAQRSDEDPDVFEVTYRGEHTCKNAQEIIGCDDHLDTSRETTDISSFNPFTHFIQQTTTSVNELIQGMELANQLRLQLNATSSSTETGRDLVVQKILSSYEKALMILNSNGSIGGQPHDAVVVPGSSRSSNESPQSDDFDGVVKESQAPPSDASKKRKTMSRWTAKVKVNPANGLEGLLDDGFSWRKICQTPQLGAKFPRSYYGCTYRHLKGCLAAKQVNRSDKDPDVFEITYRGEHTCKTAQSNLSNPESREYMSTIAFSERAEPQEIIECDDHLDTSQETTAAPSFNSFIHFLKQATASIRASSSSIIDHHHLDNKDFRCSFSPSQSPSTTAAGDFFYGDGHESYMNPDSELSNIETEDVGICVSTGADEDFVNCRRLVETFDLKTVDLLLLVIPSRSIALNIRAECLVEVYLPGSNGALVQDLVNLKQLELSCSGFTRMPDLSRACKLQSLDLHSCNNLVDVSSIQYLTKLEHINLKGCTSLTCLPSLMALKFLLSLDVSDCINLRRLPPSLGCLSSLTALDLRNCKRIQKLPKGILRLKSVQTLSISGCSMLLEQAAGPEGMLIDHQVNPIAHNSSRASDEEVSTSYQSVDKYVSKIPLQQPEEERVSSKCNSTASKDVAEPSSTTQDLEWRKEVLKGYTNMPVEAVHQANAFYDLQRTIDSLTQTSSDLHERASLQDLMNCLEELQENVPETMARMHDARVSRGSFQVKLVQAEEHYSALVAQLLVISDQEEDLDAEIERLLAKRQELLD